MRPSVDKVDSEAPGFKICSQCRARASTDMSSCPSCGGELQSLRLVENQAEPVDGALAKANLQRMRGQYDRAEEICLGILRESPQHFECHLLLGDISADQHEFERAVQWYEMAVELDRESAVARERLNDVRERSHRADAAKSVEQLGIRPHTGGRTGWLAAAALGLIAISTWVAYNIGRENPQAPAPVIRSNVAATKDATVSEPESEDAPPVSPLVTEPERWTMTAEERLTTDTLRKSVNGNRVVLASVDPRTRALSVTFNVSDVGELRLLAAEIAREALAAVSEAPQVTVRAIRDNKTVYMADVLRQRLDEVTTSEWQATNPTPDAWLQHILTNEWFSPDQAPSDPSATGTGTGP